MIFQFVNSKNIIEKYETDIRALKTEKAANEETKTVLFDLAEQEKNHLSKLGRLMEDML